MPDVMEEYLAEVRKETAYEIVRSLRAETDWSAQEIAKVVKLSGAEVEEALSEVTA